MTSATKSFIAECRARMEKAMPKDIPGEKCSICKKDEAHFSFTDGLGYWHFACTDCDKENNFQMHRATRIDLELALATLEKCQETIEDVERRAGTATLQSGFEDAQEVAEWCRTCQKEVTTLLSGKESE